MAKKKTAEQKEEETSNQHVLGTGGMIKPPGNQIQVKFVTSLENYRMPETLIFLPTHLRRYGLSEVVNHLLGLGSFLQAHTIIKCVYGINLRSALLLLAAIRVQFMLSNGFARRTNNGGYEPLYVAKGHTKPVFAVQVAPSFQQFASSSADGTVKLWTTASIAEDQEHVLLDPLETLRMSNKRHKGDDSQKLFKGATLSLEGHFGPVHGLSYDTFDSTRLFSGGDDHALRVWDIITATNVTTKTCEKPFLSLSHSTNLVASGHADSTIRVWDPRAKESSVVKLSLTGHLNWISSVQWQGSSQHRLISASYDGTIRIWDLRSKTSQFTLLHSPEFPKYDPRTISDDHPVFQNKVLALSVNGQLMASGGQDCQLKLYRVPSDSS
ncbi:ribosome biogenesis protein ytm1 [Massospora cicadina]|nr:ribosome biogenesis protein ytm1 [Massospora cicadina]